MISLSTATVQVRGFELDDLTTRRIDRQLQRLGRRLPSADASPLIDLTLEWHPQQRRVKAQLRIRSGQLGRQLTADASAPTADQAVRIATTRIERQHARREATARGVPSYGVPSRRFPERSRLSRALRESESESGVPPADSETGEEFAE